MPLFDKPMEALRCENSAQLKRRVKELEGRLRRIASAEWVAVKADDAAKRMRKLAQDALKEGK